MVPWKLLQYFYFVLRDIFNWISFREKFNFCRRKVREKDGDAFARSEGMFERRKEKLRKWSWIRQRMTQASFSLQPVARVKCMGYARKFRHPGDWMNSVNKKCVFGHCAPCTEEFNDATVSFSILFSLPVWANVESRVF